MPWGSVIITLPIHPLVGQAVVVEGMKRQAGRQYVQIRHPDGSKLGLPLDWTDRWPAQEMPELEGRRPLLAPDGLQRVALIVAAARQRVSQKLDSDREGTTLTRGGGEGPESRLEPAFAADPRAGSGCLGASGAQGPRRGSRRGGRS